MTLQDCVNVFTQFFGSIWLFFTELYVPVLNIPFSYLFIAFFLARLSIKVVAKILGESPNFGAHDIEQGSGFIKKKKEG